MLNITAQDINKNRFIHIEQEDMDIGDSKRSLKSGNHGVLSAKQDMRKSLGGGSQRGIMLSSSKSHHSKSFKFAFFKSP